MYPETKQLERESNAGSTRRKSNAPLLHHGGELPDALALLAKNVLGAGGADDDLSAERRHAHLHTGVSLLRKLLGKKLDPSTEYNTAVGAKSGEEFASAVWSVPVFQDHALQETVDFMEDRLTPPDR